MIRALRMVGGITAAALVLALTLAGIGIAQGMGGQGGAMGPGTMGQDHMKAMQEMHKGVMGGMRQPQAAPQAQGAPAAATATAAKAHLTQTDLRGPVTIAVTYTPAAAAGEPISFAIKLDTHSVDLDGYAFDAIVFVRDASGREVKATAVEKPTGSGHHRAATLLFPPQDGRIELVVKGVGGVAERTFRFEAGATK